MSGEGVGFLGPRQRQLLVLGRGMRAAGGLLGALSVGLPSGVAHALLGDDAVDALLWWRLLVVLAVGVGCVPVYSGGRWLMRRGQQHGVKVLRTLAEVKGEPYVLYLRPFVWDAVGAAMPDHNTRFVGLDTPRFGAEQHGGRAGLPHLPAHRPRDRRRSARRGPAARCSWSTPTRPPTTPSGCGRSDPRGGTGAHPTVLLPYVRLARPGRAKWLSTPRGYVCRDAAWTTTFTRLDPTAVDAWTRMGRKHPMTRGQQKPIVAELVRTDKER